MAKLSIMDMPRTGLEAVIMGAICAVVWPGIVMGGLALGLYGLKKSSIKDFYYQECAQYVDQNNISENLCDDPCLRKHYIVLRHKYQIDDINLVYNKASDRCSIKDK